jgi:hypothetical protein
MCIESVPNYAVVSLHPDGEWFDCQNVRLPLPRRTKR